MKVEEVLNYLTNQETRQELINNLQNGNNQNSNNETIRGLKEILTSLIQNQNTAKTIYKNKRIVKHMLKFSQPEESNFRSYLKNSVETQRVDLPNPIYIFQNFLMSKMKAQDRYRSFKQFLRIFKKLNLVINQPIVDNWIEVQNLIVASMENLNSISICLEENIDQLPKNFSSFLFELLKNSNHTLIYMKIPTLIIHSDLSLPKVEEICFQAAHEDISSKFFELLLKKLSLKMKSLTLISLEKVEMKSQIFQHFFPQQQLSTMDEIYHDGGHEFYMHHENQIKFV